VSFSEPILIPRFTVRSSLSDACREDERQAVMRLVAAARMPADVRERADALARRLVTALRENRRHASGVDILMREFSLSSLEGVALMCLAEALLRIPDRPTADRLIRDKIGPGDWERHLGHSSSLFVNAATWGLVITGKLVATSSEEGLSNALGRLVARGGEPVIRGAMDLAMKLLGRQFVLGETIAEAIERSIEPAARGYRHSYDMLGEAALTADDAERYRAAYEAAIQAIGSAAAGRGAIMGSGISVKLSALHPRYARAKRERVLAELAPRLKALMLLAKQHDIGFTVDAEEADRLELSLDIIGLLARDPDLAGWNGMGLAVQAYQKRAPFVIDHLAGLARQSGRRLMVRLVKGAYWDSEIKRAQADGHVGYPVFTRKVHTDVCYLACAKILLEQRAAFFPQFATHNAATLATIYEHAKSVGAGDYEFQCLHGMGEALYDGIVGNTGEGGLGDGNSAACRIYAPVGTHETLLAYLVRRLLENGANASFVHRVVDEKVDLDELVADPVAEAARLGGAPHAAIPLPADLYREADGRANSRGCDLADEKTLADLAARFSALEAQEWRARPLLATPGTVAADDADAVVIRNPADRRDGVGAAVFSSPAVVASAIAAAYDDRAWASLPAASRAAVLERAADLLEENRDALVFLCVREAGKTIANGFGEVREAADFCRYYAGEARRLGDAVRPLGAVGCISPWNFPLAIFTGQVAAALAAGNNVLAKPAEQTPLIAAEAVRLLHEAGVPRTALQLLPGAGDVGAAIVADPRIAGVVFTGSNEAAQAINRSLAARAGNQMQDIPLIAETGGQNAMIVDSSALSEQVVADAIASAFDSAGQRCSALRVLCLQDDIAERVIAMLKGAMRELAIGDPALLATDIGPVIDDDARTRLLAHLEQMRRTARWHFELPLPDSASHGTFVAPFVCEIGSVAELMEEVFGPVLHIVRFARGELDQLLDDIDATEYGLTMGVHSRIDETITAVARRSRAGNLYVNRNMIGAVVGVQPFGGEGLSGTGPKAGGPLYVARLCHAAKPEATSHAGITAGATRREPLTAFDQFAAWIADGAVLNAAERAGLLIECAAYRDCTLAGLETELGGPTGEKNTLAFHGRGRVLLMAGSRAALLHQLAAAFATMNHALIPRSEIASWLADALPGALSGQFTTCDGWRDAEFDAVLLDPEDANHPVDAGSVRRELAARDGAIVPLILAAEGGYPLERLIAEKAVSTNTAAAGGNATLMQIE
jgi:RHH-type proline utilization regulon transcriptional repressor/proline dehydrogenase/delta 1-pyrroline-5-carboxylate dehydrogenase